jgi:glycosyltransferase involved in cell wall biosynthesis
LEPNVGNEKKTTPGRDDLPLVSVCILSFNRLQYLKLALSSFRESCTYPRLEYVVVDNGSSSDVVEFIHTLDFAEKKILNAENRGIGHAMNQAREAAGGEYYFNLENDWYFFYRSGWMEEAVRMFDEDRRNGGVDKSPPDLPLGLVKFALGAKKHDYTNNPSLMSRQSYLDVGPLPQYGREFSYVSEDVHRVEPVYIRRYREKYACAVSETPCAFHIGGYTTNPNYGNRGKKTFSELDDLLRGELKNGKWWLTYQYMNLRDRLRVRSALRRYRKRDRSAGSVQ